MDSEVDECAERRDVVHFSVEYHARAQVVERRDFGAEIVLRLRMLLP